MQRKISFTAVASWVCSVLSIKEGNSNFADIDGEGGKGRGGAKKPKLSGIIEEREREREREEEEIPTERQRQTSSAS